jgi:circadian clock protein KaiB
LASIFVFATRTHSLPERERSMSDDVFDEGYEPLENGKYVLRLYVVGSTPQSSRAITNLKAICEIYLKDRYDLTVVDLYQHQGRAQADQILVAPTLVRCWPLPVRRMIGDLSRIDRVLAALDLSPTPPLP